MAKINFSEMIIWKYGHVADTEDDKLLVWRHPSIAQPDEVQLQADKQEYLSYLASTLFQKKRKAEYPPIETFLDAQVKKASDDSTVQAEGVQQEKDYFKACEQVKAKFPKPRKGV